METVDRLCKKDHFIEFECGTEFTIKKGKKYRTSLVNQSTPVSRIEPKLDHVVVFSKYWVSVPLNVFKLNGKEGAVSDIKNQSFF